MANRWGVLGLLFLVRTTMAFQFESVAAISPVLQRDFGVGLGEIGTLIGLYLLPGVVIALPGGAIGRVLGDKRTVLVACSVMFAGNVVMALSDAWTAQMAGRLLSGTGGVILNIITTKMVADWFAQNEISTAMALFLNSWPFGIAIALLALPPLGVAEGYRTVFSLRPIWSAGRGCCSVWLTRIEPSKASRANPRAWQARQFFSSPLPA